MSRFTHHRHHRTQLSEFPKLFGITETHFVLPAENLGGLNLFVQQENSMLHEFLSRQEEILHSSPSHRKLKSLLSVDKNQFFFFLENVTLDDGTVHLKKIKIDGTVKCTEDHQNNFSLCQRISGCTTAPKMEL